MWDTRERTLNVRSFSKGFSLMELLIAVSVLAILAALAIPSYQFAAIKSARRAAQGFLMNAALRQNQVLLDRRSYAGSLAELGIAVPSDVSKRYTVTVTSSAGPPPSYTITATPIAGTPQAGDGALSLTSAGVKSPADKW